MLENYSLDNWKKGITGLGIEISSDCNLRCKYCYYYRCTRKEDTSNIVTDKDFYANIDSILGKIFEEYPNIRSLDFWGAEPLLHVARIKYVVKYIINCGKFEAFDFLISSNMFHENSIYDQFFEACDEFEKMCAEKGINLNFNIQTSIDFPRKIHDKYRINSSNKNTFSKVKHNYLTFMKRVAKKNYENITFACFTKSTYNYQDIELKTIEEVPDDIVEEVLHDLPIIAKCKDKCKNFTFNIDYFATPATGIGYSLEDGMKNYVYYRRIFENFEKLYMNGQLTYANAMFFLPGHLRIFIADLLCLPSIERANNDYPVCRSGVTFVGMRTNGDIFPCHHFFSMTERDNYKIGNIFTGEYNEELILTQLNTYYLLSETFQEFENKVFMPKYSENLHYGSLSIISKVFYRLLLRHFCFAENCEFRQKWSLSDLDSLLKIYPVQWLEQTLAFISKFRRVLEAIADKQFKATYKDSR